MAKSANKNKSPYGVHPGVMMMQKWIAELKQNTGRTLDEWIKFIKKNGPKDEKSCRDWLKRESNLGTNSAWWLAERAFGDDLVFRDDDPAEYLKMAGVYVEEQYAGAKASLRPIYEKLLQMCLEFAHDL